MTHAKWPALALICLTAPVAAQDTGPLSAIDWLSQSVSAEITAPAATDTNDPPIADSASSPEVRVTPLDAPTPDAVGLLSPATTGLPTSLWSRSDEATLITLVQAEPASPLPALQEFLTILMLAEADAPLGAGADGALFLARVDKLLDMGALAQAQSLLEQADPETPALFRRWFDVALLTGTEDSACDLMEMRPTVAPTYPARIFCLARSGDWPAAALTLNTHRVLGDVTEQEEALLSRFLDPELYEGEPVLPPPVRVSPLIFRMREAIGEGLVTAPLPLAFAYADLRDTTGWKAQLDAAERLSRNGALPANTLQDLFTSRTPSASGGVWDRVEAFQRFDTAIRARDPGAVASQLPAAWAAMKVIRAEVSFATLYAAALQTLPLNGEAATVARDVILLSSDYETLAQNDTAVDPFLAGIAVGDLTDVIAGNDLERAIAASFSPDAVPPAPLMQLAEDDKLGEALLRAMAQLNAGLGGDPASITDALALFRAVGLEDLARRAALQTLLLDRAT